MDWIAAALRRIVEFTQAGGEINVVVTGINVGAQPYWNAEATMLMHTRGILVMTPEAAMVLTGKQALDFAGQRVGRGQLGHRRLRPDHGPQRPGAVLGPGRGRARAACCSRYYDHTYVAPGERFPRRAATTDAIERDVRAAPAHRRATGSPRSARSSPTTKNPGRKQPFDMRAVMRAVVDRDHGAAGALGGDARRRDRGGLGRAPGRRPRRCA